MSVVLKIAHAQFGYRKARGFKPVVRDVSLYVHSSDFVILQGPNGCGKSTILRAILQMGAEWTGQLSLHVPLTKVGYIPQESVSAAARAVSAADVVRSALPFVSIQKSRITQALEQVGLEEKASVCFGDLSGGQRRRVLVARALVHDPDFFILDEPTANIDRQTEQALETLFMQLTTQQGKSVLATTHVTGWAKGARRIAIGQGAVHE